MTDAETALPIMDEPTLLQMVAGIIFRDPIACFGDFALYRTRLQWVIDNKAWSKATLPLLAALLEFENTNKKLPNKIEMMDAYK
jgi:hypothetical protein